MLLRSFVLGFLLLWQGSALPAAPKRETALDRYVREPDSAFQYKLAGKQEAGGLTAYVLDMTSQRWRSPEEVDRTEWKHWLTVIKPEAVKHATGFLFITGGSNESGPPKRPDGWLLEMARYTSSVVAELRMVPNQPLVFAGETQRRNEDALIAYTWDKFLRGGDEKWPARLPMTKSAVRAMDAVTGFLASAEGGGVAVNRFVVSGASKRGWTTWATAAVDSRVIAIVPIVIDVLNVVPSMGHHWRAYGFWAPAVRDYEQMRLFDWRDLPQHAALMRIEDPYEYRERFTMPKYIVNSAGDQFFLPDSSQFYFDRLPGEKLLRYIPNTDHSLRDSDARETVAAYYDAILNRKPRPRVTWKMQDGGIRVTTKDTPAEVKLWQATNPAKRDFRLVSIGKAYQSTPVNAVHPGVYEVKVSAPAEGWTAYFVELTYSTGGKYPLKVTTPVRVTPETLPFPPYEPKPIEGVNAR